MLKKVKLEQLYFTLVLLFLIPIKKVNQAAKSKEARQALIVTRPKQTQTLKKTKAGNLKIQNHTIPKNQILSQLLKSS